MPGLVVPPVERSTVVDRLTSSLIDAALSGHLTVGEPLPPERELAADLDVNRTTLRQAVARLEQIGLVRRRQGSGTVLCDPRTLTAPEVVGRLAASDHVSFLADLVEVREALAEVIGRRARGVVTAEQRSRLHETIATVADPSTTAGERQLLELAFFAELVRAAGNQAIAVLLRWVEDVYANLAGGTASATPPSIASAVTAAFEDGDEVAAGLRMLLETIDADGDLAAAMTSYARTTGARLVRAARAAAPPA